MFIDFNFIKIIFTFSSIFAIIFFNSKNISIIDIKRFINSTISGEELFLKICKESEISTSSCDRVFRRKYLIEGGYSYENQIIGEDELFTLKTLIEAKVCFSTSEKL